MVEAIDLASVAVEGLSRVVGPDHPVTLIYRSQLGESLLAAGRTTESIATHEGTLKLMEAKLGPDHPHTLTSRNNLANAYQVAGRTAEAVPLHEGTLKLMVSRLGPTTPPPSPPATTSPPPTSRSAAGPRPRHCGATGSPAAARPPSPIGPFSPATSQASA
jgi:hypothetical protein